MLELASVWVGNCEQPALFGHRSVPEGAGIANQLFPVGATIIFNGIELQGVALFLGGIVVSILVLVWNMFYSLVGA